MKYEEKKLSTKVRYPKYLAWLLFFLLLLHPFVLAQSQTSQDKDIGKIKLRAVLTPPYVLGPGDQLTVIDRTLRELFGQVERYDLVVSGDGYISIPLPDGTQENILAAGYTLDELSGEIRTLFSKTLRNPLVFVQISRYRPINVYIGGEVLKPGVYKIETSTTQEKGGSTSSSLNTFGLSLTQAIQLAGGLKPRANIKSIFITRGTNSEKKVIDLKGLILGESTLEDVNLHPGDAIFIPIAENPEDQAQNYVRLLGKLAYQEIPVSIVGEVKAAGNYILPNDATLLDAIGMAGGLNEVGSLKKIRLSRFDENGIYRTFNINVHDLIHKGVPFDAIALRPGDSIELEPSKGKEIRHFIRDRAGDVDAALFQGLSTFIIQDNLVSRFNRTQKFLMGASPLNTPLPINIVGD